MMKAITNEFKEDQRWAVWGVHFRLGGLRRSIFLERTEIERDTDIKESSRQ